MKVNIVQNIPNNILYKNRNIQDSNSFYNTQLYTRLDTNLKNPNFKANPITELKGIIKYIKAQRYAIFLENYLKQQPNFKEFPFRNISMEPLEGLQYGIKVFKGLSMKDIQYLSENLHVIAVKRGCNNMCGYCYADAKPSKREMSWEDFTQITQGFKKLRSRLGDLPLYGENLPVFDENPLISRSTELFYDADCMNIAIKDRKRNLYDFTALATELNEAMGRKTVFDTSGWEPKNELLQKRAEKYAEYFSVPENMDKLNGFNLSFNVFNASYIAAVKALQRGDVDKYQRLREKFVSRLANAVFTFTPLLKDKKFAILTRCFGLDANNAQHFDIPAMIGLMQDLKNKLHILYQQDLNGKQKYVKSEAQINEYKNIISNHLTAIDTGLNSSGRMKQFMEAFNIQAPMQDHTETTKAMIEDLEENGRYHLVLANRLIDADGKVYHMDYARFFPTEIQLNISDRTPAPSLANMRDYLLTKEIINRPEFRRPMSDFTK